MFTGSRFRKISVYLPICKYLPCVNESRIYPVSKYIDKIMTRITKHTVSNISLLEIQGASRPSF